MGATSTVFPPTPPRSSAFIPYRPFDTEESKDEDIKETVEKRDAETTDDDLNIREVGEIFSHLCII